MKMRIKDYIRKSCDKVNDMFAFTYAEMPSGNVAMNIDTTDSRHHNNIVRNYDYK